MGIVHHINLTDDNNNVYCHAHHQIMPLDGQHVAEYCWNCPLLAGFPRKGTAVDCLYVDSNVGDEVAEAEYSDPNQALAAAPETPDNLAEIASDPGMQSLDTRQATMLHDEDQTDAEDSQ